MRLHRAFWLALSLAVCLGFALGTSRLALFNPLVVHDDVRQHVFWAPRLHDSTLFAGDWIADYYQSQAPVGYQAVYWAATLFTDAITVSKVLPLVLTLILALAGFWLSLTLWRRADTAALCTALLVWSAWQYDDVASATPRAYALPLLTLQLAALAAGRQRLALAVLPLQAVLYPLGCALAAVTMSGWALWRRLGPMNVGEPSPPNPLSGAQGEGEPIPPSPCAPERGLGGEGLLHHWRPLIRELVLLAAVTLLALGLVAWGQMDAARYGPTVSGAEARAMAEFQQGGRAAYFVPSPYQFWLESSRSGFALGPKDPLLGGMPALTLPFGLAVGLALWMVAGRLRLLTPPAVPRAGVLLLIVLVGSLTLWVAAHWLLFLLYLPARHVQFSLPLVWALAGGLCWTLLGEQLTERFTAIRGQLARTDLTGAEAFALVGIGVLALHPPPPGDFYVTGRHPAVYAYLRQTPPSTLVAALPSDGSTLPLFGQRGVLTSYEHLLPYHPGYYHPLRERTEAFRSAYYAPTLGPLAEVIHQYGVGVVVADAEVLERRRRAERERPPALEALLDRCGVLRERELVVMPTACIVEAATGGRP